MWNKNKIGLVSLWFFHKLYHPLLDPKREYIVWLSFSRWSTGGGLVSGFGWGGNLPQPIWSFCHFRKINRFWLGNPDAGIFLEHIFVFVICWNINWFELGNRDSGIFIESVFLDVVIFREFVLFYLGNRYPGFHFSVFEMYNGTCRCRK